MVIKTRPNVFYGYVPARVLFVFLCFVGVCLVYAIKVVLSVAMLAMAGYNKQPTLNSTLNYGKECPADNASHESHSKLGEFDWTSQQQAIILGGYFYGYVLPQLPAGILAERLGAKWIFGSSVLIASVLSILGPIAARTHYILFFLTRFGQGLAGGVTFPCVAVMLSRWMPKVERSRGTAIILGGSLIGIIIAQPLAGYLCDGEFLGGWPAIFYVLGVTGIIWFILWSLLFHETPDSHPYMTQREYDYIKRDQEGEVSNEKRVVPWKSIFTSMPVFALIVTQVGQMWGFNTILILLPTYFTKILHLDIKKNGLMSSLPYLIKVFVTIFVSVISDKVRQSGKVTVNVIRKFNNTIALIGPATCLVLVVMSKCNTTLSILFFTLAMALNGFGYSGIKPTPIDMAPDFAGTLMGLMNSVGNLSGFLSPIVAAKFYATGQTLENWSYIFYLAACIYTFSAVFYAFFATAKLQSWGTTHKINAEKTTSVKNKNFIMPVLH